MESRAVQTDESSFPLPALPLALPPPLPFVRAQQPPSPIFRLPTELLVAVYAVVIEEAKAEHDSEPSLESSILLLTTNRSFYNTCSVWRGPIERLPFKLVAKRQEELVELLALLEEGSSGEIVEELTLENDKMEGKTPEELNDVAHQNWILTQILRSTPNVTELDLSVHQQVLWNPYGEGHTPLDTIGIARLWTTIARLPNLTGLELTAALGPGQWDAFADALHSDFQALTHLEVVQKDQFVNMEDSRRRRFPIGALPSLETCLLVIADYFGWDCCAHGFSTLPALRRLGICFSAVQDDLPELYCAPIELGQVEDCAFTRVGKEAVNHDRERPADVEIRFLSETIPSLTRCEYLELDLELFSTFPPSLATLPCLSRLELHDHHDRYGPEILSLVSARTLSCLHLFGELDRLEEIRAGCEAAGIRFVHNEYCSDECNKSRVVEIIEE